MGLGHVTPGTPVKAGFSVDHGQHRILAAVHYAAVVQQEKIGQAG